MKFLNESGELIEGTPLTDEQLKQREQILQFVHEKACGGRYHGSYERKTGAIVCETIANFFVTKFRLVPLADTDFDKEIEAAHAGSTPQAMPATPHPVSTESAAQEAAEVF